MSLSLVGSNNKILELPPAPSIHTLSLLHLRDIAVCSRVNKTWRGIANDDRVWYPFAVRLGNKDNEGSKETGLKSKVMMLVLPAIESVRTCANPLASENHISKLMIKMGAGIRTGIKPNSDSHKALNDSWRSGRNTLQCGFDSALLLCRIDLCTISQVISFQNRLNSSYECTIKNTVIFDQLIDSKKYDDALKFIKKYVVSYDRTPFYYTLLEKLSENGQREKAIEIIKSEGKIEKLGLDASIGRLIDLNIKDEDFCLELLPLFRNGLRSREIHSVLKIANHYIDQSFLTKAQEMVKRFEEVIHSKVTSIEREFAVKTYIRLGETEKAYLLALKIEWPLPLMKVREAYLANGDKTMVEQIDKILQKRDAEYVPLSLWRGGDRNVKPMSSLL